MLSLLLRYLHSQVLGKGGLALEAALADGANSRVPVIDILVILEALFGAKGFEAQEADQVQRFHPLFLFLRVKGEATLISHTLLPFFFLLTQCHPSVNLIDEMNRV